MFQSSFPIGFGKELSRVLKIIPLKTISNIGIGCSELEISFYQQGREVSFPYRIYFEEPEDSSINQLNHGQKMILHCIYTRSSNGFVRQKHISQLLKMDYEYWCIPFIFKLCDEYVVEILKTIYDALAEKDNSAIIDFCYENEYLSNISYNRMISYWNEYYRTKEPQFRNYIGRTLFHECFGFNHKGRLR